MCASCVTWSVEDGVAILGFADDPVDTEHYLLLILDLSPDDQDRALLMDRLYVEMESQANSAYGELVEAEIIEHRVRLRFDPAAAAAVSSGEVVEIILDGDPGARQRVIAGLALLVGPERLRVVDSE
jgi:hypothetical protein